MKLLKILTLTSLTPKILQPLTTLKIKITLPLRVISITSLSSVTDPGDSFKTREVPLENSLSIGFIIKLKIPRINKNK